MKSQKSEIVSFNEEVPELSQLLELDGAELDVVIGGLLASKPPDCPALTSCGTYTGCGIKANV